MSERDDCADARETYMYLRGGLVVLVFALAVGIAVDWGRGTCLEASVSAYYFTSEHSIFIGVLCAAGALLVIYGGSSVTEDVLLSLAGILAIVVALVPTGRPPILCGPGGLPADYDPHDATTTNIWTLGVALVVVGCGRWAARRRRPDTRSGVRTLLGVASTVLSAAVLVGGFLVFLLWRNAFDQSAHGVSAVGIFLAITATVGVTALLTRRQTTANRGRYFVAYLVIFATMVATIAVVVVLHFALSGWNHLVLLAEAVLLLEFTIYWLVQTYELRDVTNRNELLPETLQDALASRMGSLAPRELLTEVKDVLAAPEEERLCRAL